MRHISMMYYMRLQRYRRCKRLSVIGLVYGIHSTMLPERAPADVALAEVLVVGRLLDQPVDLLRDVERLFAREVSAGQLVPHALDYV